jgi:4-alpha-glucanotransferase
MNTPGKPAGNWTWRFTDALCTQRANFRAGAPDVALPAPR